MMNGTYRVVAAAVVSCVVSGCSGAVGNGPALDDTATASAGTSVGASGVDGATSAGVDPAGTTDATGVAAGTAMTAGGDQTTTAGTTSAVVDQPANVSETMDSVVDAPIVELGEPQSINSAFTRLTRDEFEATVAAAFSMEADFSLLPVDGRVELFTSNALTADPVHPYVFVAEDLVAALVPSQLPSCSGADVSGCVTQNYGSAIEHLFRRPATAAELTRAASMIEELESQGVPAEEATRAMLASILLQPDFLFRSKPGAGEETRARALAEHLSFALWDAPPDAELIAATTASADLGLALTAQATRLADDPRVIPVLARFLGQWLRVDVDLRRDEPGFEQSPLFLELVALVEDALLNDVSVMDLVSGTRGFVHSENQAMYATTLASGSQGVSAVTWPATSPRRGILSQELFQDALRHPDPSRRVIFRGRLVRTSLLCDEIPLPSAELVALAEEVGDRLVDVRCAGCHSLMDPIGGAFVSLDDDFVGTPEPTEIVGQPELTESYADLPSMLDAIAKSRVFAECFSKHFLGFFLEQQLNAVDPTLVAALADSVQAGGGLDEVLDQAVQGWEFRTRSAIPWCEGP